MSPDFMIAGIAAVVSWVIAGVILLFGGWFPAAGRWMVGILAPIVDVFATLHFLGWRHS